MKTQLLPFNAFVIGVLANDLDTFEQYLSNNILLTIDHRKLLINARCIGMNAGLRQSYSRWKLLHER